MTQPYNGDPAVVAIYGPSGIGKTTDLLYSFPRGFFIAPPGAIKPAHNVVGFVPDSDTTCTTIEQATAKLKTLASKRGQYDAVIVDDLSILAEQTVASLEAGGKLEGLKLWGKVRETLLDFRNTARHLGLHVILTAHESTPRTAQGAFLRGGPKLPGRMPEDLPTTCDSVLRAAYEPNKRGWHAVFRCTVDDPSWVTKDRHGIVGDKGPMNTGEFLRAAGYTIRRAPGLEWMEELVETLAQALLEAPKDEAALVKEAIRICGESTDNPLHTRWVLRDSLDRAAFRRTQQNALNMFLHVGVQRT
jgi:hypothetical protein